MKNCIPPSQRFRKAVYAKAVFMLPALLLTLGSCETGPTVTPTPVDFDGTYAVQESKAEDSYVLTLHKKADKLNVLTLENLANLVKSPLEVRSAGDKLLIAEQSFTSTIGTQYTISGDGKLTGDVLTLHYTIKGYNGYNGAVYAKKQAGGTNQVSGK